MVVCFADEEWGAHPVQLDKSEVLNERSRRTEGEKGYLAPAAALNRFGRKQILISLASVGIREHYIRRAGVGPP